MTNGIEVVVRLIIRHKDKILLVRSPKIGKDNQWSLPGGHVEHGETFFEAVIREGAEETGLSLTPIAVIESGEGINPSFYHRPAHFVCFSILSEADNKDTMIDEDEIVKTLWAKPEKALTMDVPKSFQTTISKYLKYTTENETDHDH